MRPRRCANCRELINRMRLKALPDTATCTECSRVSKVTDRDVELDGTDREELVDGAHRGDSRHD